MEGQATETTEVVAPIIEGAEQNQEIHNEPAVTLPNEEEDEFDITFGAPADTGRKKLSGKSLREFDEDMHDNDDDEIELDETAHSIIEKALARGKEYKQKANDYKNIAEAHNIVRNDPNIKFWSELHAKSDADLIKENRILRLINAGKTREEAELNAEAHLDRLIGNEELLKDQAEETRLSLETAITQKSNQIQSQIQKSAEALSLSKSINPDLSENAVKHLSKMGSFLGLTIGGKNKEDMLRPVVKSIKDGSVLKQLNENPELLAEVSYLLQYKKEIQNAIEKREPNRKKAKEAIRDAPYSGGSAAQKPTNVPSTNGIKDIGGFIGKKK